MLEKIDHIGIAVFDMDEALKKYERLFGIKARHIEEREGVSTRIAFIQVGESMIELLAPVAPSNMGISQFLKKNGEGISHIAYRVENLSALLSEMKQAGVKLRDQSPRPGGAGARIAFIDPVETGNVLTELVEREKELA